ncbi:hypothetical protein ACA910_008895 [Epithemia clementina (nom. ined.)]
MWNNFMITFTSYMVVAMTIAGAPIPHSPNNENNENKNENKNSNSNNSNKIEHKTDIQAVSPPAALPRRFLAPSHNENVRGSELKNKRLDRRRQLKKGSDDERSKKGGSSTNNGDDDDDDSGRGNSGSSSNGNNGGGALAGSVFLYVQDQLDNTVTEIAKREGEDYSSEIGKFTPNLFCTATMCAGIGRAELIGESPERDDEDYLEVIISGPPSGTRFNPDGSVGEAAAVSSWTFFCPSGLQELKDFEVIDCECFAGDPGSCVKENFSLSPTAVTAAAVLNPFTIYYTTTGTSLCTTGFRAQLSFECRD